MVQPLSGPPLFWAVGSPYIPAMVMPSMRMVGASMP